MGDDQRPTTTTGSAPTTVLVVDDHPVVRSGLVAMLMGSDVSVAGEAATGRSAVAMAAELRPDVVLMDVRLPDIDGIEATRLIKEKNARTALLLITNFDDPEYVTRAIAAGASGYLLKGSSRALLLSSITAVREGGSLFDGALLSRVVADLRRRTPESGTRLDMLTPRELDALRLVCQGMTNREIAEVLNYSTGSIKNIIQEIIEKLGVSDRTQAAVVAVRAGLDIDDFPRDEPAADLRAA